MDYEPWAEAFGAAAGPTRRRLVRQNRQMTRRGRRRTTCGRTGRSRGRHHRRHRAPPVASIPRFAASPWRRLHDGQSPRRGTHHPRRYGSGRMRGNRADDASGESSGLVARAQPRCPDEVYHPARIVIQYSAARADQLCPRPVSDERGPVNQPPRVQGAALALRQDWGRLHSIAQSPHSAGRNALTCG